MAVVVRLFSRIALLAMLVATLSTAPAGHTPTANTHRASIATSVFYPEVRLRKLHLVRPDLIPYPIYYKIYC
jgi:hypothetical protein